jgi:hypothetical protein
MPSRPNASKSGVRPSARLAEIEQGPDTLARWHRLFPDDAACRRYLAVLRWEAGFWCPHCWQRAPSESSQHGLLRCSSCASVCSPTLGTVLERHPIPLRWWLRALFELVSSEAGAGVERLSRALPVSDPAFTWAWLEQLQGVYRRAWRDPLRGVVEVAQVPIEIGDDESATVAVAVEVGAGEQLGRTRLLRLGRDDVESLGDFLARTVTIGSPIRASTWQGYAALRGHAVGRLVLPDPADDPMSQAQRVASILRLWLWSTHVTEVERLDYYLDEFSFRYEARLRGIATPGALFNELLRVALEPESEFLRGTRAVPR